MPRYRSPKLYTDLASWFHLLTSPDDYAGETEFIRETLSSASPVPIHELLDLGSGGGNNAFHLKSRFRLTLMDIAPAMIETSRAINPECEHFVGDMRSARLGRLFDAVLVHDAIMYMTTPQEMLECMTTARAHTRPGGVALFLPDLTRETFAEGVHHGGRDSGARSLRYIEWTFDPDPADTSYTVDFAILARENRGPARVTHDQHVFGLFSRKEWMDLLRQAGFEPQLIKDPYEREVFLGR
ncbi:MAG TPA: class I SAM-dependent methyltransferase [Terriglobia bacterium]|nr:class I SAM-dependent methyltransferase [Terriglobia bacterium]